MYKTKTITKKGEGDYEGIDVETTFLLIPAAIFIYNLKLKKMKIKYAYSEKVDPTKKFKEKYTVNESFELR